MGDGEIRNEKPHNGVMVVMGKEAQSYGLEGHNIFICG